MPLIQTDLFYDPAEREPCVLDLYLPDSPVSGSCFPLLVWFHGGGLTGGTRHEADAVAERFAVQGIAVANADYRLGPDVRFPVYIEDAARAVAWAVAEGVRRGADPGALFVGGHSAGAYLAAMLAMDTRYLASAGVPDGSIAGYLPISGQLVTHFQVRAERRIPAERLTIDEAAPLHFARKDAPPILLLVGDQDMPARREEAALFVAVMTGIAGNQSASYLVVPDRDHGTVHEKLLTPGDPGGPAMLDFMARHRRSRLDAQRRA